MSVWHVNVWSVSWWDRGVVEREIIVSIVIIIRPVPAGLSCKDNFCCSRGKPSRYWRTCSRVKRVRSSAWTGHRTKFTVLSCPVAWETCMHFVFRKSYELLRQSNVICHVAPPTTCIIGLTTLMYCRAWVVGDSNLWESRLNGLSERGQRFTEWRWCRWKLYCFCWSVISSTGLLVYPCLEACWQFFLFTLWWADGVLWRSSSLHYPETYGKMLL